MTLTLLGCHGSDPTFDSDFSKIYSTRKIIFHTQKKPKFIFDHRKSMTP